MFPFGINQQRWTRTWWGASDEQVPLTRRMVGAFEAGSFGKRMLALALGVLTALCWLGCVPKAGLMIAGGSAARALSTTRMAEA